MLLVYTISFESFFKLWWKRIVREESFSFLSPPDRVTWFNSPSTTAHTCILLGPPDHVTWFNSMSTSPLRVYLFSAGLGLGSRKSKTVSRNAVSDLPKTNSRTNSRFGFHSFFIFDFLLKSLGQRRVSCCPYRLCCRCRRRHQHHWFCRRRRCCCCRRRSRYDYDNAEAFIEWQC